MVDTTTHHLATVTLPYAGSERVGSVRTQSAAPSSSNRPWKTWTTRFPPFTSCTGRSIATLARLLSWAAPANGYRS